MNGIDLSDRATHIMRDAHWEWDELLIVNCSKWRDAARVLTLFPSIIMAAIISKWINKPTNEDINLSDMKRTEMSAKRMFQYKWQKTRRRNTYTTITLEANSECVRNKMIEHMYSMHLFLFYTEYKLSATMRTENQPNTDCDKSKRERERETEQEHECNMSIVLLTFRSFSVSPNVRSFRQ